MADLQLDITFSGNRAMIDSLGDAVAKQMGAILFEEAETIMAASKQVVPVDTGALRSTGKVRLPETTVNTAEVTLGYGGPSAPYALLQHETPPEVFRHNEGQTWKYLERPMFEAAEGMEQRLASRLAAWFRGVAQ